MNYQLHSISHLAELFRKISLPREFKGFLKLGLSYAQTQCLALRVSMLQVYVERDVLFSFSWRVIIYDTYWQ